MKSAAATTTLGKVASRDDDHTIDAYVISKYKMESLTTMINAESVSIADMADALVDMTPSELEHVVSQRSLLKKCGYPRCKNAKIESIDYCSDTCMNAINELLSMLNTKSGRKKKSTAAATAAASKTTSKSQQKQKKNFEQLTKSSSKTATSTASQQQMQEKPQRLKHPPSPYYDIEFGSEESGEGVKVVTLENGSDEEEEDDDDESGSEEGDVLTKGLASSVERKSAIEETPLPIMTKILISLGSWVTKDSFKCSLDVSNIADESSILTNPNQIQAARHILKHISIVVAEINQNLGLKLSTDTVRKQSLLLFRTFVVSSVPDFPPTLWYIMACLVIDSFKHRMMENLDDTAAVKLSAFLRQCSTKFKTLNDEEYSVILGYIKG